MGKKISIILIWFLSLIIVSIYTYQNPDKFELIKSYFSKNSYKQILDLPNFEDNNVMHEIIPKKTRYKFDTIVCRDLIFKKCDAR